VARLNISIPDPLHARLERLRDTLNLSEICTMALDRAVAVAEAQPAGGDPLVAQMLERLQTAKDLWHGRGVEDGRQWAALRGTLDELQAMAGTTAHQLYERIEYEEESGDNDEGDEEGGGPPGTPLPATFSLAEAVERWVGEDTGELTAADASGTAAAVAYRIREAARKRVEYRAYLEGWLSGVNMMVAALRKGLR